METLKTVAALVVGILIFIGTFYLVGIDRVISNLSKLNPYFYLITIVSVFGSISMWTLRWEVLIRADGYDVSRFQLLKTLFVGLAFNSLTPVAKFGGEPIRAYLLKKNEGIKMREGFGTILAELTIMFITTVSLVIISVFLVTFFVSPPIWLKLALLPFGLISLFVFMGIVGIYSDRDVIVEILKWLGRNIERLESYKGKILKRYKEFQETFRKCLSNKKAFLKALLYSIIGQFLEFVKFFTIFLALGYQISPVKIIIIMGIGLVLISLPSTPGSLGIYEAGLISALALLKIPAEIAAPAVFLARLLWFWSVTTIGSLMGAWHGLNLFKISDIKDIKG